MCKDYINCPIKLLANIMDDTFDRKKVLKYIKKEIKNMHKVHKLDYLDLLLIQTFFYFLFMEYHNFSFFFKLIYG